MNVGVEVETSYIQIESQNSTTIQEMHHFRSALPKHILITNKEDPDYFLPLGWLVEIGVDGRESRTR